MIEITRTAEARQLEDGTWKEAIYYSDEMHDAWRAIKKQAKETGRPICLSLKIDNAIVQHPAEVVLSNTIDAAEELVTVLKNALHMIAGSRGEALPNFDAKAEKVNNDLSSAVTVASDGPGPLEIILETPEGEKDGK